MRSNRADRGRCGCMAWFRRSPARPDENGPSSGHPESSIPVNVVTGASFCLASDHNHVLLRQQVQGMVAAEMKSLQEGLNNELQSVLGRLHKADGQPPSPNVEAVDDTPTVLPLHSRSDWRRHHTCGADGTDNLVSVLRRVTGAEDSEGMRREDVLAHSSTAMTPPRNVETHARKSISFGFQSNAVPLVVEDVPVAQQSLEEEHADVDRDSTKSGSSVVWRIDALDCGDRLAASAAARKGSADVNSIVELVESERERWAEEKLALETRLEELKEQRQMFHRNPDAEKAELKQKVQELRNTMKQRSRFGAWVCERHMQESDDEEASPSTREKEELRETMSKLEAELRDARAQAGNHGQAPDTSEGS